MVCSIDYCNTICCSNKIVTTVTRLRILGIIIPYIIGLLWLCVAYSQYKNILDLYKIITISFTQIGLGGLYFIHISHWKVESHSRTDLIDKNFYINIWPLFSLDSFISGILIGNVDNIISIVSISLYILSIMLLLLSNV